MPVKFLIALALLFAGIVCGQPGCQPPALVAAPRDRNIFTDQAEMDLGDAVAEHLGRSARIFDAPELVARIEEIGARLAKHLPPTGLKFRFFLVELRDVNAYTMPGGRIYVSRKLVSFVQNEDELAGVIAHELGHAAARHPAVTMSTLFREILNVNTVGDRRDIFEKYSQMTGSAARKPEVLRKAGEREKEQQAADQVGLYILAAAGYDREAFVTMFDRLAGTQGKTGNFFSDLLGATRPEAKRLREMLRAAASVPASCIDARKPNSAETFEKWQADVVETGITGPTEDLHGVLKRVRLDPPLRMDLSRVRFSPDGKYVLAQDDTTVTVLTRQPFAPLFQIPAEEAFPAQFTPDSQRIVFHNPDLRVEKWNIAAQKKEEAHELVVRGGCVQTALAPDGRSLGCLDHTYTLQLIDVAGGPPLMQRKTFNPDLMVALTILLQAILHIPVEAQTTLIHMGFSPDARYFVAASPGATDIAVVFDIPAGNLMSVSGQGKDLLAGGFVFITPDRVIALNRSNMKYSAVLQLPRGNVTDRLPMPNGKLEAATNSNYILVRPAANYAVGVLNPKAEEMFKGSKTPGIDMLEETAVSERRTGELAMYQGKKNELLGAAQLPLSPLARFQSAQFSIDGRWLAISTKSRASLWDLNTGKSIATILGYRGGFFYDDGVLAADFPKEGNSKRHFGFLNLEKMRDEIGPDITQDLARPLGPFLMVIESAKKGSGQVWNVQLNEPRTKAALWSRTFQGSVPEVHLNFRADLMTLELPANSQPAGEILKSDPALKKQLSALKDSENARVLQILDSRTGAQRAAMVIDTGKGSYRIRDVEVCKEFVIVSDSQNRVVVYSRESGATVGRTFGSLAAVDPAGMRIAVRNTGGEIRLHDLATMAEQDRFQFASTVSRAAFRSDGQVLNVLTSAQEVLRLDVSKQ